MLCGIGVMKLENIMRDKKPLNDKGQRHGHFLVYYSPSSDNLWWEAYFINGVEHGYEMTTYPFGKREKTYTYYAR
jgi:hypothetical protein